jgi:hypothetical protein
LIPSGFSISLPVPIFFSLARDRRRGRVLDLQPAIRPAGAVRGSQALRYDALTIERATALAMRVPEYGLRRGAPANFIALPARHVPEAVVGRPPERSVYRSGKLIARSGKLLPERNSTDRP